MDIGAFTFVSVLLTPWILGAALVRLLGLRFADQRLAFIAWAWMAGALATALCLVVCYAAGVPPWSFPFVIPAVAIILQLASCTFARREGRANRPPLQVRPGTRAENAAGSIFFATALVAALSVMIAGMALLNTRAIVAHDEAMIWAAKAKAIYLGGGLGGGFAEIMRSGATVWHMDYPLLNPLLQVWVFLNADGVTQVENRLPLQMSAIALLLLLASAGCRVGGPWLGGAVALLFATSVETRFDGFKADADLLVGLGFFAALDARARFDRFRRPSFQRLHAVALVFLVCSKNEGSMLALCLVIADLAVRGLQRRRRAREGAAAAPFLLPLVPAACAVVAQAAFNSWHRFQNDLLSSPAGGSLFQRMIDKLPNNAPVILDYLYDAVFTRGAMLQFVPLLFVVFLVVLPDRLLRPPLLRESGAILLGFAGFMLVYLSTPHDIEWHLRTSLTRVLFQIYPVMLIVIATVTAQVFAAALGTLRPGSATAGAVARIPHDVSE